MKIHVVEVTPRMREKDLRNAETQKVYGAMRQILAKEGDEQGLEISFSNDEERETVMTAVKNALTRVKKDIGTGVVSYRTDNVDGKVFVIKNTKTGYDRYL